MLKKQALNPKLPHWPIHTRVAAPRVASPRSRSTSSFSLFKPSFDTPLLFIHQFSFINMSAAPESNNTTISSPPAKRIKTAATMEPIPLQIKKLSEKGRLPTRGSAFAAGYDIYAARDTTIPARGKALVDTDISMAIPEGTYGRIAPRSGLASKNFIDTGAGVIDADYRGQVKVLLFNHAESDFEIKEGDRIAQLILERIYTPEVVEVQELADSVRGAGGFGSTGLA
ncbi:hypothetical protein G7Z17_g9216 [Cylindrodendrum hubeiense]|uniref:Deoxyuridine 5'-triphosphate nucleotidohydrolase n=1 Tax=Cylindrodendrum hubeiense TaxID=595255 RepID=A0A9P5H775_9HYPO|nr:hypothetical protein G7Z17_g9216 [Cylindrodendrum hubeiense]